MQEAERLLVADLVEAPVLEIVLPQEPWWLALAGGIELTERYAWDKAGEVTVDVAEIVKRANIREAGLRSTTPVGMYPAGRTASGLYDMSGNVWEWQAGFYDKTSYNARALWGGSWDYNLVNACVSYRYGNYPYFSSLNFGFRVVAPIVL